MARAFSDFRLAEMNPEVAARVTRLRQAVKDAGGNRVITERTGIGASRLTAYLSGEEMKLSRAAALAAACGVTLDWLVTGEGSRESGANLALMTVVPDQKVASVHPTGLPQGYVMIPRYDVRASAGTGSLVDNEQMLGFLAFDEIFLRRELGVVPEGLVTAEATGDSMEPTIKDGNLLVVDTLSNSIQDGRIYLLNVHGLVSVKRLHVLMDGSIAISSDNPKYSTETVRPTEHDPLRVIGRVVYVAGPVY